METTKRRKKVERAIANERLEGLKVSKFARDVFDDYVVGKISADEAADQIFSRYGVK